ncbi:MAG TPA: glycoside hydrolase family 52 protein, partial [Tepidisphaeraceae bacterium]
FAHDMGVNNNFSPSGTSSYELSHRGGCFSYMTQEELCNWILTAACYVVHTRDTKWLTENGALIVSIAESMRARANPRSGIMAYDSALCVDGQEITTYDSLDESLGQARANTYLAAKCWASWLALEMFSRILNSAGEGVGNIGRSMAADIAAALVNCVVDETIPAVLEKENPGYHSRIIPVIESLIYPAYWLQCLQNWKSSDDLQQMLAAALQGPFIEVLRRHTIRLLSDPQTANLFPDGGIKLSSTSNNSWMSKIAIAQYVARVVLRLHETEPTIAEIFRRADAAHVRWQTDGSSYWACSDQFINGEAKGSRYYPRIITAALWLDEQEQSGLQSLSAQQPQMALTISVKKQAATGNH